MQQIPLQPVPNQTLSANLGNQACQINVYQKRSGLYCDLYVNGALIIGGVLCENLNRIVRDNYLGFVGDLGFLDTTGSSDPTYTGLGGRFVLFYLEADDVVYGQPFFGLGSVRGTVYGLTT